MGVESGQNGQNGHLPTPINGGRGRCALTDLIPDDPGRQRGAAELLGSAIRNGYLDAFVVPYADVKRWAEDLARSDDQRIKAAGVKLLTIMANHDLKLWGMLSGGETPNVQVNIDNRTYQASFK